MIDEPVNVPVWSVIDRRILDETKHCIASFCGSLETAHNEAIRVCHLHNMQALSRVNELDNE